MVVKRKFAKIVIEPPGPKARQVVEGTNEYLVHIARHYPLVVESAQGSLVRDVDGNQYIDFASGLAVLSIGSSHPSVVEAIKKQAESLIHYSYTDWYYPQLVPLSKKITEITPGDFPKQVFFGNSGAEAIEAGIKLARNYTNRPVMISHTGSFHGRTIGALSLTASKPVHRKGFSPLQQVVHIPFPECYRCPWGQTFPECGYYCVDYIREQILDRYVPLDDVSAYFFEPCQGEGGYVIPPPEFFKRMEFMREKGVLFVADEVQTGIGRTGAWFACEKFGIVPDVLCMSKALASGLPISATVVRREIAEKLEPGQMGSTFGGNPVAAEAALATLEVLEKGRLVERADKIGKHVLARLKELQEKTEIIGDVRGLGLFIGLDIVKDKKTKERAPEIARAIVEKNFRKGLITVPAGRNIIRIIPPLNIQEEILEEGLAILEENVLEARKLTI